ncbi:hypothetical protein J437_LFUL016510 [Ladona fulva]|uniref:Scavenger receptor class B member 1 n=1 Tax=Ladona fulva TaxID=123851 RepID=A0A8K0KNH4_LADFU|nr:hypothetical protein J437_LFUL016510 [Ladona fulva]
MRCATWPRESTEQSTGESAGAYRAAVGEALRTIHVMVILFSLACITFGGAIVMWTTNIVDTMVLSSLVIRNGTQIYDWWVSPPVETLFRVRIFNYTNHEAYLNGTDKKFQLQELGPYTYRAKMEKANVEFDDEGEIVTFQENRSYEFLPDLSPGVSLDDQIIVPNLALLVCSRCFKKGAASVMHDSYYIVRMTLASILKGLQVEPFLHLQVGEFLWGYDDTLFTLAKSVVPFQREMPMDRFGLLAAQNGLSLDRVSIHTGLKNQSMLGLISEYNGENSLPYWGSYECNRVDGSEGTIFPQMPLKQSHNENEIGSTTPSRFHIFNHQLCRRFPLEEKGLVTAHGFPALRFEPIDGVFDDATRKPEHKCFCDPATSVCPPSGVFNATPCAYGAPIMVSFPHFYLGSPSLMEPFEGLKPTKEEHEFFLDIQPTLGIPLGGRSRFQLNVMVRRSKGIWQLNKFPHDLILPIAWIEVAVEDLPQHVRSAIKLVTETSEIIERTLMILLITISLLIFIILMVMISRRIYQKHQKEKLESAIAQDDKTASKAFIESNG